MKKKGSLTIEAAILTPLLSFVILTLMQISFFLYNREAATVMVSQAALQGVQMEQEGKNTIREKLDTFLSEEVETKLLFINKAQWNVSVTMTKVRVSMELSQKTWFKMLSCEVEETMTRQNPASVLWESERWSR